MYIVDELIENKLLVNPYNYLKAEPITIIGVNYSDKKPQCFRLIPYLYNEDGSEKVYDAVSEDMSWQCVVLSIKAPTAAQFGGVRSGNAAPGSITVNWSTPQQGIYTEFEIFWKKKHS